MRPQKTSGLSWSRALALLSPRRRLSAAAGIGFSLALALVLSSCEGSPTRVTTSTNGGGGGGGGQVPPPAGFTPVQVGEPFEGTVTGSDVVCNGPAYYYLGGPCQRFAIAVPGKAGTLTVQLAWNEPGNLLALSSTRSFGWATCCESPLTSQVTIRSGASWELVQVVLIGPKDPTGSVGQATSQKFTLTTSFSPQ